MANIKVLGDVELNGLLSFDKNFSDFPQNPQPRTIIVKDGIPYIYTELVNGSGFLSWQPIGIKQASYLHTQGVASTTWTVTHNFNSNDFAYFVYDENHRLVVANIEIIDLNTVKILLSEAMTGTVVLFSLQYLNSTTLAASQQLNLNNSILTTDAGVLKVSGNAVAYKTYVDSQDSALSTRIDNIVSNIDPVALDSLTELVTAFQGADGDLSTAISSLSSSSASTIATERTRAMGVEASLQSSITAEISRAEGVEAGLASDIANIGDNLATVATSGSYADLTNKPVIPTVPSVVSAFSNDSGYLVTSDISGKADKATTLAGYSISDAYTKSTVDTQLGLKADKAITLAGYGIIDAYTKTDVDLALSSKAAKSELFSGSYLDLTNKPNIPTVPATVSAFTNDSGYLVATDISGKADKASTYTKAEVDALIAAAIEAFAATLYV